MADTKITALTAITTVDPAVDVLPIVDVSDTTMAASGTTKKITSNQILGAGGTATLASATITGDLTVDTNVLKVDTSNNRVGIGTASPTSDLDIFRASGSGITSGISLRTAAGAGGGSFIKWLGAGSNEKVAQIDGVLNGTDVGYLSFQCGNGADAMAEQYRIASNGLFTWFDGAGGTRMTLNSTGLGVGASPSYKLDVQKTSDGTVGYFRRIGATINPALTLYCNETGNTVGFGTDYAGATSPAITFTTGGSERVRIDASGNLLVGTTTNTNGSRVFARGTGGATTLAIQSSTGDTANPGLLVGKFDNDSTTSQILVRFTINNNAAGSGQITANGANAAAFGTFSDSRLKENIASIPSQLEKIVSLRPVEFDFKNGSGHQIGFVAQEMQEVYPDVVGEQDGFLTITGWSKTEARLVSAIKELAAKVQALEAKLA
jgi:hypothetical protein